MYSTPATSATCRWCGSPFSYDADHYLKNTLAPPRSCQSCRAARKARSVEVRATIGRVTARYIFAKAEDGAIYYISPTSTRVHQLRALAAGDVVVVAVDPAAPVVPGRRPQAFVVRRA